MKDKIIHFLVHHIFLTYFSLLALGAITGFITNPGIGLFVTVIMISFYIGLIVNLSLNGMN